MKKKTYSDFLKPEEKLQARLVSWIKDHPILRNTFWFHYPGEGNRTPYEKYLWTVMGCKKSMLDLFFLEPNEKFTGLVLEIKTSTPWKRDGTCKFPDQEKEIIKLRDRGYHAGFYWTYESAKKIIEEYFDL